MAENWQPKKPVGEGILATWRRWIWDNLQGGKFPIRGDGNIVVQWINGFYRISSTASRAGSSTGSPWQTPNKELDPTVAVAAGTWVFISLNNPLAQTGLIDLISDVTIIAQPGIWVALQSVPATSGGKYNVPAEPTPGIVSGSPLSGDLDSANMFWARIDKFTTC